MPVPRFPRLAVVAVVATFVTTLIVAFPARVALAWFAPEGLAVSGVEGSVWRGRAAALQLAGLGAGPVSWRVRPMALLLGRIEADVEGSVTDGFASGRIGATLTGVLRIRDARASLPLERLTAGTSIGPATGQLQATIDSLRLVAGWPESISGELQVMGVRYPVPQLGNTALGSYSVTFPAPDGDATEPPAGQIRSLSGPYDVSGTLGLLPGRRYALTAEVRATASAQAPLRNALQFLGRPNERGYYTFRSEGTL